MESRYEHRQVEWAVLMESQETKDTIEDMEFQIGQCKMQKENQLAVLAGEVAYLNEHQVAHSPSPRFPGSHN